MNAIIEIEDKISGEGSLVESQKKQVKRKEDVIEKNRRRITVTKEVQCKIYVPYKQHTSSFQLITRRSTAAKSISISIKTRTI